MYTPSAPTTTFNDILASFDRKQHVTFPTLIGGHWLDLLITRSSFKYIETPTVSDVLSNHDTLIADTKILITPAVSKHKVFYRAIHSINIASDHVTHPKENVSNLYEQYRQILKTLLDKHPPSSLDDGGNHVSHSKIRRRYLERVWYTSRSSLNRSRYSRQCHQCNREMAKAKLDYNENMFSNNSATPQELWK